MKKTLLTLLCLTVFAATFAQKPSLNKAYNLFYEKDFVKAKDIIDQCAQDEKLSENVLTWLYMGNIYYYLSSQEYAEKQKNPSYQVQFPDAPVAAYDAFVKSKSINAKKEAMDMFTANDALKQLYPYLLVRGSEQLIAKDYAGAQNTLKRAMDSYEMDTPQYPMNGDIYLYYAYALESQGKDTEAQSYYTKALDDGANNPAIYIRLIESAKKEGNREKAQGLMADAIAKLPADISIRIAEVDYYYWMQDTAKAKSLLQKIPTNNLTNADDLINLANVYIKSEEYGVASALLKKANTMTPNNFVILYNLGTCTYYLSQEYFKTYNEMAVYNANDGRMPEFKQKSDQALAEAADYFEQARTLEPKDLSVLTTLRAIYNRQNSPKADQIDAIIKSLE